MELIKRLWCSDNDYLYGKGVNQRADKDMDKTSKGLY